MAISPQLLQSLEFQYLCNSLIIKVSNVRRVAIYLSTKLHLLRYPVFHIAIHFFGFMIVILLLGKTKKITELTINWAALLSAKYR